MRDLILAFPKQFPIGLLKARDVRIGGPVSHVVISAMGGSALAGEILLALRASWGMGTLVTLSRSSTLPDGISAATLLIAISYSGNTEETLASFEEAKARGLKIAAISSGGELAKRAKAANVPWIEIPENHLPPRLAVGYMFASLVSVLVAANALPDVSRELEALASALEPARWETPGRELAKKLEGKILLFYASPQYEGLALIWKIKANENAKTPAFQNVFSEINHNEIEGFSSPLGPFAAVILRDPDGESPRMQKRITLTKELLDYHDVETTIVDLAGKSTLEKLFNASLFADWTTLALAEASGVDPMKTPLIEEFKKDLEK